MASHSNVQSVRDQRQRSTFLFTVVAELDVFVSAGGADEHLASLPADETVPVNADQRVPRIELESLKRSRIPSRRAGIGGRGRFLIECFMRSILVVLLAKEVECALLGTQGGSRRFRGLGLESAVKPFLSTILLRVAGRHALASDCHP